MKKKFIFYNKYGLLLPIAQRIEAEGYECFSFYTQNSHVDGYVGKDGGKGMVNIVDDFYDTIMKFKDCKDEVVIIIDDNSAGDEMDYLRSEGWHVVGSSHLCDEYEYERDKGAELAEKMGLKIPPSISFNDLQQSKDFLTKQLAKGNDRPLYFKGDGADVAGGSFTFPANDIAAMLRFLDWVAKEQESGKVKIEKFKFQEIIQGLEADFSVWTNGEKFAPEMAVTFEQKKIHGLGQAEGCLGQLLTYLDPKEQPYFQRYLKRLLPYIKGDVANSWAVNNIVDEKGDPYFLEFTPRHGWDSTQGELALLQDAGKSIAEFYIRLAFKMPFPTGFFPVGRWSAAIRFYTGGIGKEPEKAAGKPIFWEPEYDKNIWWYSIKGCDDGHKITGNPVGVATACGDTPEEAMRRVYEILEPKNNHINLPDIFYSETIGENVSRDFLKLKKLDIIK